MAKRIPVDCRKITALHLAHLDEDELGEIAVRIELQTQALNRAFRMVADAMEARRK
jgi:hypothetical protein